MAPWLGPLFGVIAALGVIASLTLVVASSWQRGKIAELRADFIDVRAERDDADRRAELAEHDRDRAHTQLVDARTRIAALTEAVTQAAAVQELARALNDHRRMVEANHTSINADQKTLLAKADEALRLLRERST